MASVSVTLWVDRINFMAETKVLSERAHFNPPIGLGENGVAVTAENATCDTVDAKA